MSAPVEFKLFGRSAATTLRLGALASDLKDLPFSGRMQMLCFTFQHHFEMARGGGATDKIVLCCAHNILEK